MDIQVASDLHLTYDGVDIRDILTPSAPVLVLAGDIINIDSLLRTAYSWSLHTPRLLDSISQSWDHIIMVPGNHEYYSHRDARLVMRRCELCLGPRNNVHLLNNVSIVIEGVRFVCSTMWSPIDPIHAQLVTRCVHDYNYIGYGDHTLTADDVNAIHNQSRAFIQRQLQEDGPTVVVTHHLPSSKLVSPMYKNNPLNSAFAAPCDDLLATATLWVYGHSHDFLDTDVCGCRAIRNPKGYSREVTGFINDFVIKTPKF